MGIETVALLEKGRFGGNYIQIAEALTARWSSDLAVLPLSSAVRNPPLAPLRDEAWTWDEEQGYETSLRGPDGFLITFGSQMTVIYHVLPWGTFLSDPASRNRLHRAVQVIAQVWGAGVSVYVPDNGLAASHTEELVYQGESLETVKMWLHTHVGAPLSFADLDSSAGNGSRFVNEYVIEKLQAWVSRAAQA